MPKAQFGVKDGGEPVGIPCSRLDTWRERSLRGGKPFRRLLAAPFYIPMDCTLL